MNRDVSWKREDIDLDQLFVHRDRTDTFRVVGIADEATVILRNERTGEDEHHVITSRNFAQFAKLTYDTEPIMDAPRPPTAEERKRFIDALCVDDETRSLAGIDSR